MDFRLSSLGRAKMRACPTLLVVVGPLVNKECKVTEPDAEQMRVSFSSSEEGHGPLGVEPCSGPCCQENFCFIIVDC